MTLKKTHYHSLLRGEFDPVAREAVVPDFGFNLLNESGEIYKPIIDLEWVSNHDKPIWPEEKPFAVCLSHDVDAVSETNVQQNIRSIRKQLRTISSRPLGESLRWVLIHKLNALRGLIQGQDNLCDFEKWIEVEADVGAHSTFFFAAESIANPHATDCMYTYNQPIKFKGNQIPVAELMRILDHAGWEIGLHPSWHTHNNIEEMRSQKQQIETILNHRIQSIRQHFLKYDPLVTPAIQHAVGFKYDSTLGFNDNVGFRRGSSYPFQSIDLKLNKPLPLLHIPLTVQDGALMLSSKGLRLDPDTAVNYVKLMLEAVKEVGGVLNLSWHPHTIHQPGFWDVYRRVLTMIQKENPWFATIGELGDWWQNEVKIDLMKFTHGLVD